MGLEKVLNLKKASEVKLVGGKAASLGKMLRGGFAVPNGFVITARSSMKMTKPLEAEILSRFNKLGAKYAAVRSSAVAEDSSNASWAGQFDTFLHVTRNNLIEYIKKCWASAESS